MPNWHPKNTQKGMVLIWMIVWLAGMAAIYYWCVLKHIPAIEQRIESNAQTALSNGGYESIDVTVSDRIATLSGAVNNETERANIVNAVSAAAGVRSVNDGLTLLAHSSTDGGSDNKTDTASTGNNDNIVAKAVIPATPKPAETNSEANDTAATSTTDSADTQASEQEANIDSSDTQKTTTTENTTELSADTQQATPSAVDSDTQTASTDSSSDNEAMAEETTASQSVDASEKTMAENVTPSTNSNDSDAASTDIDNSTAQVIVTDVAADSMKTADAQTSDIENKANERIKEALAKQEQAQTDTQVEQVEQVAIQMQAPTLNMQVDGKSLIITGDISENDDALDLIESAMNAFATPIVVNKIQTHKNRSAAPWLKNVVDFLPKMQGIENPGVRINDQQIVLSGDATSETAHDEVINQALSSLPALALVERMRVIAPQAPEAQQEANQTDAQAVTPTPSSSNSIEDFFADYDKLQNTTVLFESGSDQLTEDSVELVIQIAAVLNKHANISIGIDGHTDNAGQSDANLRLSQARSNAVRDTLIDQGVDVERINAYGFGDSVPIADNSTPEGRRLNRRIEFNFKLDQSR